MKVGKNKKQAFTIVELLVVIVVIGILAAITIVSYSGIQNKAIGANLRTDLVSDSKQLKMYNVEYGHYPSSIDTNYCPATPEPDTRYCLKAMNGAKLSYVGGGQAFTLFDKHTATGITYKISEGSEPAISVLPASFINQYYLNTTSINIIYSVDITNDDGYVVSGRVAGNAAIVKFNSDNSASWANYMYINGGNVSLSASKKTSDGGFIAAGMINMSGSTNNKAFGYDDMLVMKFSSTKQLSWMKIWGSSGSSDHANDVIQTSDGGYAVTGTAYGSTVISKFASDGTLSWNKTYIGSYGNSIIQTSDSGFAVSTYGDYIIKTDSSGDLSWAKTWHDTSVTVANEDAIDLIQTSDGGYAVTGSMTISQGRIRASIIKLAPDGSHQWHNYLSASNNLGAKSIIQTYNGDYVIAGSVVDAAKTTTKSDAFVSKFSSSGVLQWFKSFGNTGDSEAIYGLALTADGGYLAVGEDWIGGSGSVYRMIVMKYKSDGTMNNCTSPTCKSGIAGETIDSISFADATPTIVSQSITTMEKTLTMSDVTEYLTKSTVAAP